MADALFNSAHNKVIPAVGDVWVITLNGVVVASLPSAEDCKRMLWEALSKTTQRDQAACVIAIYHAKKADLLPLPITTVGPRFAT